MLVWSLNVLVICVLFFLSSASLFTLEWVVCCFAKTTTTTTEGVVCLQASTEHISISPPSPPAKADSRQSRCSKNDKSFIKIKTLAQTLEATPATSGNILRGQHGGYNQATEVFPRQAESTRQAMARVKGIDTTISVFPDRSLTNSCDFSQELMSAEILSGFSRGNSDLSSSAKKWKTLVGWFEFGLDPNLNRHWSIAIRHQAMVVFTQCYLSPRYFYFPLVTSMGKTNLFTAP